MRLLISGVLAALMLAAFSASAQVQTADKIVAVVGKSRIVLQSDLESRVAQMRQQDPTFADSNRCGLLQQIMLEKLLVEQAERDSVIVSEEEVEGTLENRIRYFVRMYGTKERLEQASGKTIYQIKDENRETIKETMLAERVQNGIVQNVKVTPSEVRTFYAAIPQDSLPFFPATVEIGQIVIDPPISPELDTYARQKIVAVRERVTTGGESFETVAGLESSDPGSRDNGGDLGTIGRGDLVPEFSAAAWRLQPGEISPVVKTKFGYHVIQMVQRQGDNAHLRHILIPIQRSSADYRAALKKLDSVRSLIIAGTVTFPEAVGKFSTDDQSKLTGGMNTDPQSGSTRLPIESLDAATALLLDSLQPGVFTQPQLFTTPTGEKSARIVWMKSRTEPHKANLTDDYNRLQEVALAQKKNKKIEAWLAEKLPTYYVRLAPEFAECSEMARWQVSPK